MAEFSTQSVRNPYAIEARGFKNAFTVRELTECDCVRAVRTARSHETES